MLLDSALTMVARHPHGAFYPSCGKVLQDGVTSGCSGVFCRSGDTKLDVMPIMVASCRLVLS